jgi:hypothetical protein
MGFDKEGVAKLGKGWREENESGDAAELSHDAVDKQSALRISAKGSAVASWRVALPLEEGRYRFEANVRTRGVVPLEDDKGAGAGLRISGATERRTNSLTGDKGWVPLAYEFSLDSAREVTLVAELRATKGDAWFSLETLRLRKVR